MRPQAETKVYHLNLLRPDSDGDGFKAGAEIASSHVAFNTNDYPALNLSIYTAIELEFITQTGGKYQLQASPDLNTWTNFDDPIEGDGGVWTKTYSIRSSPRLYYRVKSIP